MTLLLVTHSSGARHVGPTNHPERPARLEAAVEGVMSSAVEVITVEARPVMWDALERIHDTDFVDTLRDFCARGGGAIDEDTYASEASFDAAIHAAGAGPTAVDELIAGGHRSAFVAVRPPGHHAERDRAMGFCLFNNVAVTAGYLRSLGFTVAIVDWDVHHGNGTQNTFYQDPGVLYVSLHQSPFYPGTGGVSEVGTAKAVGTTVNIPLPAGTTSSSYRAAFGRIVVPVVEQFSPDWILVSNGYDAHSSDPIGELRLEASDYRSMASWLQRQVSKGRVIAMLEGGYDLAAVSDSSGRTAEGLSLQSPQPIWTTDMDESTQRTTDGVVAVHSEYWELR